MDIEAEIKARKVHEAWSKTNEVSISDLCKKVGICRSTYYEYVKLKENQQAQIDAEIRAHALKTNNLFANRLDKMEKFYQKYMFLYALSGIIVGFFVSTILWNFVLGCL